MNQLSCLFLSDDIFIINICNNYKSIGDQNLVNNIKTCINFNSKIPKSNDAEYILDCNFPHFQKYKGIVIVKNLEDFSSEYIIVDCFLKKKFKNLSLNAPALPLLNTHIQCDYNFMQFLKFHLKKCIFNTNIAYYNSLFDGNKYLYSLNTCTKLDFDILVHNFLQIIEKESIENIEFDI